MTYLCSIASLSTREPSVSWPCKTYTATNEWCIKFMNVQSQRRPPHHTKCLSIIYVITSAILGIMTVWYCKREIIHIERKIFPTPTWLLWKILSPLHCDPSQWQEIQGLGTCFYEVVPIHYTDSHNVSGTVYGHKVTRSYFTRTSACGN